MENKPLTEPNPFTKRLLRTLKVLNTLFVLSVLSTLGIIGMYYFGIPNWFEQKSVQAEVPAEQPNPDFTDLLTAPSERRLLRLPPAQRQLVEYGRELIAHTSDYLGPKGSVLASSNGMNCQNCHLNAGTQPWGNNYLAVQANYPKFRARSGQVENQVKRVNDCFERSLNGKALDSTSREMQAILAYIAWVGTDVPAKTTPRGSGIYKLKNLDRPTDPVAGKQVYELKCQSCHQANGEGVMAANGKSYTYPPLWGEHSYNSGAGLYRISNFAGYVKYNMPFGITYEHPQLTDEESWDVAAFVNSQPRPAKDLSADWPDIAAKPFDHPFGPYADPFSEKQHKFGPYGPIQAWKKEHANKK
ncbi:c-type cytochrome [Arundinibacter roseus]|uniref:C-type cytochrome n=1 Tax=Arundinibacter roseus TaxID=2070510 RepID=A0A4V2XAF6_9BACT|nr:c-type cytochrome [Arundinibacter roseus]TDB67355.1 c-type cytochrome [Arundinibacter roseus]